MKSPRPVRRLALVGALVLTGLSASSSVDAANASVVSPASSPAPISVYISGPGVEGPPTLSGLTMETFNTLHSCPSTSAVNVGNNNALAVGTVSAFGLNLHCAGAATTSATPMPHTSPTGSDYPSSDRSVHAYPSGSTTITLARPVNYLGAYWFFGDDRNTFVLKSGATNLVSFSTNDLMNRISTSTISAIGGATYTRDHYLGGRKGFGISPNMNTEPAVYIHFVAPPGVTFDKIELSNATLEFDNLAIANYTGTFATNGLVDIPLSGASPIATTKQVTFDANDGSGTSTTQASLTGTTGPLNTNTFTRAGFTFAGWNTQANGSGTSYADGAQFTFSADVTLYAQWTAVQGPASPPVAFVPPPPPLPTPVRVGDALGESSSLAVSQTYFSPGVDVVYLATDDTYADALVAGPRAGTEGGPILLTDPDRMTKAVADEIIRLRPASIVIVGQTNAVGPDVEAAARFLAPTVTRVGGVDRYETAVQMSRRLTSTKSSTDTVYIASGEDFADAVTSGPIASLDGAPILLTRRNSLPAVTRAELAALDPREIVIIGGPQAVSATVATELSTFADVVTRIGGDNRYSTAARLTAENLGTGVDTVFLAVGEQFHHAVVSAPIATTKRTAVLLVQPRCVPLATRNQLDRIRPQNIVVVGADTADTRRILTLIPC